LKKAVCVLVRRGDGRFLFVERAHARFGTGYWTPVTGRVEADESLVEAARREVREETGLDVEVDPTVLGSTGVDAPPGQTAPPFTLEWFSATVRGTEDSVTLQESEVSAARWVTLAEALELDPMFPTTRSFLRSRLSSS
jgi:8-oxo-dGTP diphosphatase